MNRILNESSTVRQSSLFYVNLLKFRRSHKRWLGNVLVKGFFFFVSFVNHLNKAIWPATQLSNEVLLAESNYQQIFILKHWFSSGDSCSFQVKLPLECPFHPARDIFAPQHAAKLQHRPSQWTCAFCGKSFYEERHLDTHFDQRHKNQINKVCLCSFFSISPRVRMQPLWMMPLKPRLLKVCQEY